MSSASSDAEETLNRRLVMKHNNYILMYSRTDGNKVHSSTLLFYYHWHPTLPIEESNWQFRLATVIFWPIEKTFPSKVAPPM